MPSWFEDRMWLESPRHIVSAAVVATDNAGRLLLVRSPRRGWEMPDGQVEIGESLEAAAKREVMEECGVEVGNLKLCGIFQSLEKSVVNALFRGRYLAGTPRPSDEAIEAGFFELEQALEMVTHANFRDRIRFTLDEARHPFFIAS